MVFHRTAKDGRAQTSFPSEFSVSLDVINKVCRATATRKEYLGIPVLRADNKMEFPQIAPIPGNKTQQRRKIEVYDPAQLAVALRNEDTVEGRKSNGKKLGKVLHNQVGMSGGRLVVALLVGLPPVQKISAPP